MSLFEHFWNISHVGPQVKNSLTIQLIRKFQEGVEWKRVPLDFCNSWMRFLRNQKRSSNIENMSSRDPLQNSFMQ